MPVVAALGKRLPPTKHISITSPKPTMLRFTLVLILLTLASIGRAYQAPVEPNPLPQHPPKASIALTTQLSNECENNCESADDWLLMRGLTDSPLGNLLQRNEIQIYGWTEGTFTASTASGKQLPLGFNYRANDFLLQQNWLRVERKLQTESSTPSFGFLADTILPGSDYRFTRARGLWDSQTGSYGIDPVQFYAQAYYPNVAQGLDVKAGRFFGQFGVESIAAVDTPFVSRSYTFIYNPFTHTGVLTTLQLNDAWSVQNGIVTGSDVFFDSASEPTYIGSIEYQFPDDRSSLLLSTVFGSGEFNPSEDFSNPRVFDLVYTRAVTEQMTYQFNSLYGYQTNLPGSGHADWYSFVNYWTYQWRANLQSNCRVEFFDDVNGNRTGYEGLYTAGTMGLAYTPQRSIILRPEVRFDHNASSRPFAGQPDLFTAAFDVIVRW